MGRLKKPANAMTPAFHTFRKEMANCDLATGVIDHLKTRTVQFQELDQLDMFGFDEAARRSRIVRQGDHPLVQVLKHLCDKYAKHIMLCETNDEEMSAREAGGTLRKIMETATQVSKFADGHFGREINLWMEQSRRVQSDEIPIEKAAEQLAKDNDVPYAVALQILKAQDDEDD